MKIICIGRNYADHAKELKNEVPVNPVVFLKPDTALLKDNAPFYYPGFSKEVHYEVEIVVKIEKEGKNIQEKFANKYYNEIGIGIDFTARDIQNELKSKGLPWEIAKGFNGSAPVSAFLRKTDFGSIDTINFSLVKNGEICQAGNTHDMIFKIDFLIAYISQFFTLKKGDIIYTGTPSGVGAVKVGDVLECFIEQNKMLETKIC